MKAWLFQIKEVDLKCENNSTKGFARAFVFL